jgi:polysaccharide biosynthesis transport protein
LGGLPDELDNRTSVYNECVRALIVTWIHGHFKKKEAVSILVTSSIPREGKTTSSIAIAQACAHFGMTVLLIDTDMRNASVHKRLSLSNDLGLSNFLTGSKQADEILRKINTLYVITSGPLPPNPVELLINRFESLVESAKQNFDIVILDGPPVLNMADAIIMSQIADKTLIVTSSENATERLVNSTLKKLGLNDDQTNVGILLTKYDYGRDFYHDYGAYLPSGDYSYDFGIEQSQGK